MTPFVIERWRRPPPALINQVMAERILRHLSSTGQAVHTTIAAVTHHRKDAAIMPTVVYSGVL